LQHDWSSLRGDPELSLTESLLRMVRERAVTVETYASYYDRAMIATG
jgi:hypothetical protein